MARRGKKYQQAAAGIEKQPHELDQALELVKKAAFADFDETVEVAMRLGVNPKHADQMVRGTVVLPHGTGKETRVLVVAEGANQQAAEEAGADHVLSADDAVEKIEGGWLEFDAMVATPDMMRGISRLGRVLGPRGLMPNPKSGTVTQDVGEAVRQLKAGRVEFRVDRAANIHAPVGKLSFPQEQLVENTRALIDAVIQLRPASLKGRYLHSIHVSSTMGPGVRVDAARFRKV